MSKIEGLSQREYESRVSDLLEDGEFMAEFATMIRTAYKTGHAFPDWAQVLETQIHDRIADDMAEDASTKMTRGFVRPEIGRGG